MQIIIDGKKAQLAQNRRYRGAGMVSANNSSRLLLDYKWEHPDRYWEILHYIFGEEGVGITHLKIEMGSDVNSSSGTEPCIMRTRDEIPDCTRGAGYQLAADAKTINPELTLDMLYWSEPKWVTDAEDVYAARYEWYKKTLDAAYAAYGLVFDYVSAVRNEREMDTEWIKYLSGRLKAEKACPYDYAAIRIVAADEVETWKIAEEMQKDRELLEAVDVVGSHYTSWSDENVILLAEKYGKEVWFSEASSPMSYVDGIRRINGTGYGLNDQNGILDVANRMITMYPGGGMTLYEYQPVVSAYYDGVTYCHKQLITASEPWSGYYLLDSGFFMALHFSKFCKKGWAFVDGACFGDGEKGGDGHVIVNARHSYMTVTDPENGDYSIVLTNTTAEPLTYEIRVKNIAGRMRPVFLWETRGSVDGAYDIHYFKKLEKKQPVSKDAETAGYTITLKPYSLVTVSTLEVEEETYSSYETAMLKLPYRDDFAYAGYDKNYLRARGGAPRYTTDEGGAFEVTELDGRSVLMQKITAETKAMEWGLTPEPVTNLGDDRWYNYRASVRACFAGEADPKENYVGIGIRYILGDSGKSGYWLQMYRNGAWKLYRSREVLLEGVLDDSVTNSEDAMSSQSAVNSTGATLTIEACYANVRAYINGVQVCNYRANERNDAIAGAGRVALYSAFEQNYFEELCVTPVEGIRTEIERYDDTDENFVYSGAWEHRTMSSFRDYRRTLSVGTKDAVCSVRFHGSACGLMGKNDEDVRVAIEIDGNCVESSYTLPKAESREHWYLVQGLPGGEHEIRVKVLSGKLYVDGAEVN